MMFRVTFGVCFVALNILISSDAARILAVFPAPSISHQVVFRPLTQELVKRGHEVVVITPDPAFPKGQAPVNLTEIDIHDISYRFVTEWKNTTPMGSKGNLGNQMIQSFDLFYGMFVKQIHNEEIQKLIKGKKQHFDLLLLESTVRMALVFTHVFKVPTIQVSSFGAWFDGNDIVGAPSHPILYPSFLSQRINNLTMWEKVTEYYNHFSLKNAFYETDKRSHENMKRLIDPDIPSFSQLSNNIDMLFLNVHPIWNSNRPVPPSVVYMGGLHIQPVKELPKDLKTYLDSSVNGVIYISFGTNVPTEGLPTEKMQTFIRVLSQLPYDVLWKWDQDELPGRSQNIKISKWLPQSDLLRHPKVKLFITQGGLQSTDEAINAGVPLIGIPMLGDQWYNTEKYVQHKIGLRLDMDTLTGEDFENAIKTVIEDKSYHKNIVKLGDIMRDQPQSPLERAVWWTEHVLRHGSGRHLRAPAANMSWAEYLELELLFTIALGFFIFLVLVVLFAYYFVYKNVLWILRSDKNKKID